MSDDKTIPAELPHPEIAGPPLTLGTRYAHHFLVEVISDGRRLWALASEEGQRVLTYLRLRGENANHTEFHATIEALEEDRRARFAPAGDPGHQYYGSAGVGVGGQFHPQDQGLGQQQSNPGHQQQGGQHINQQPVTDPPPGSAGAADANQPALDPAGAVAGTAETDT